jgi:hypothetical protein
MQKFGLKKVQSKEIELQEKIILNTLSNSRPQVQSLKEEDIVFRSSDVAKPKKKKHLRVQFQDTSSESSQTYRAQEG